MCIIKVCVCVWVCVCESVHCFAICKLQNNMAKESSHVFVCGSLEQAIALTMFEVTVKSLECVLWKRASSHTASGVYKLCKSSIFENVKCDYSKGALIDFLYPWGGRHDYFQTICFVTLFYLISYNSFFFLLQYFCTWLLLCFCGGGGHNHQSLPAPLQQTAVSPNLLRS